MAQATVYECAAQMRNLVHLLPPTSGIACTESLCLLEFVCVLLYVYLHLL
jgi:hypothetical protein